MYRYSAHLKVKTLREEQEEDDSPCTVLTKKATLANGQGLRRERSNKQLEQERASRDWKRKSDMDSCCDLLYRFIKNASVS